MAAKRRYASVLGPAASKRAKTSAPLRISRSHSPEDTAFLDWPAPREAIQSARKWILQAIDQKQKILIAPDKDADGLSGTASTLISLLGYPDPLTSAQLEAFCIALCRLSVSQLIYYASIISPRGKICIARRSGIECFRTNQTLLSSSIKEVDLDRPLCQAYQP